MKGICDDMKPNDVFNQLEEVRFFTLERLSSLSQFQLDTRPQLVENEENWSLGEIFMHIAIDEIYLRELISRPLYEGICPPPDVTFLPPSPPYGMTKETIYYWLNCARSQTEQYVKNWSHWNPELKHKGGIQPMNALEWLKGFADHEKSHQHQIDFVIKKLSEHS